MSRQILLLGGNQGDVKEKLKQAINFLSDKLGTPVRCSHLYESEPWGFEASQNFINQVVEFKSTFSPEELLDITQEIEIELGRQQKTGTHYESRPIDIDILFIDNLIIDTPRLTIPHPHLHKRRFTLLPLTDHWGEWIHPVLDKTVKYLLDVCEDTGTVTRIS